MSVTSSKSLATRHVPLFTHGTNSVRQRDSAVLAVWAYKQKRKLEARYGKRGEFDISDAATIPLGGRHSKRQKGYEEMYNLYSDTEVSYTHSKHDPRRY